MDNKIMKIAAGLWVLLVFSSGVLAQDTVSTALNRCAAITDDSARLTCYDALADVLVPAEGGSTVAVAAPAVAAGLDSAAEVTPITDSVGKERVEQKDVDEAPRFSAKVTSCRKNPQSGQYSFSFDNGQVWKQSNYRSLSMRNCEFDVEIAKVAFGYEMYIPSKDRRIRVSRLK